MNENNRHLEQLAERVRLAHVHVIEMFLLQCNGYKRVKKKVSDETIMKYTPVIDRYFFNENGKISWDTLLLFMPQNIEKIIRKRYGKLGENETKLCILLYFDVSCHDISNILPYTQSSVHVVAHRVKQKIGSKKLKLILNELVFQDNLFS